MQAPTACFWPGSTAPGTTYYYNHDGLGSIDGLTNSGLSVSESYLYDEFGGDIGSWGSVSNSYRYIGQEWDAAPLSGYNLRVREYYPKLGRFMQNDPIGDDGGIINWYVYVGNNSINRIDFSGTQCCSSDIPFLESEVKMHNKLLYIYYDYKTGHLDYSNFNKKFYSSMSCKMVAYTDCYRPNIPKTKYIKDSDKNKCYGACVKIHEEEHASICKSMGYIYASGPFAEVKALIKSRPCFESCLFEAKKK